MRTAAALSALLAASCAVAGEVTREEFDRMTNEMAKVSAQLASANATPEGRRLLHGPISHSYFDGTGKYEVHRDGYVHLEPVRLRHSASQSVTNRIRQALRREELRERPKGMPRQLWELIQARRLAEIRARVFEKDALTGEVRERTGGAK